MNKRNNNVESIYPLSHTQQGILFHSLYAPNSGIYFQQFTCTFEGNFNPEAFQKAWERVLSRYTVLRTLFLWENRKQPLQVVRKSVNLPWSNHDWRDLSETEQQQRLETFLENDISKGFVLNQAPLMRFATIRIEANKYQFIWSYHHLLIDGWGVPIVLKEVLAFYKAFSAGEDLKLKTSRPYQDYIAWLQKQDVSQTEVYWRGELQGFTNPTPLVVERITDNNEGQKQSYQEQHLQLSEKVTNNLKNLVQKHRLTLNSLIQGTWAILLSRYSGNSDVVFGATVSGRPPSLSGMESMVGLFINTLPVRVKLSDSMQLLPWLQELLAKQLEREQYSYSSLVDIQGWSDVPREMSLFESIVVFENYPLDNSVLESVPDIKIGNICSYERTNYPLTLMVVADDRQLSLKISYDDSRFEEETITRMLGHLQNLLEAIAANPQQSLSQLSLLSESERDRLLELNASQANYSQQQCIHQLFEQQAKLRPDAVAVVFEDMQLTYGELNERANQLGRYLQKQGVKPEVLVGICVERSLEMVISILAILKAGGAYVPLDPANPPARLNFILSDANISILVTQDKLLDSIADLKGNRKVVCLDSQWNLISSQSQENINCNLKPENLAYIIYTSGSTGNPKGVLVTHDCVTRLFAATESWFNFNETDVWTLFHSYAFDFSVWELWGALIYGGCLVVVSYSVSRDPEAFYQLLCAKQVTVLNQTPSAFYQIIQAEELVKTETELNLRLVIFGGEALNLQSLEPWFQRHGDRSPQLVNMYGITETTVHVTYRPLTLADLNIKKSLIGRPIPDLQVYVLDRYLQPAPLGVAGEMYIGGAGLSRGYLNRQELTEQRFIPNPFSSVPGERLYKSGDLARYLPHGDLEYLGRIDNQVKIRGFRIELGEIEAFLTEHPTVSESLVIDREDSSGQKYLVAYLVFKQASVANRSELYGFLKQKLPIYAIPSAFVPLDSLPLTINGKVDRRALPMPDLSSRNLDISLTPPRNSTEEILVNLWQEILQVEKLGIYENFFELGGHSLIATKLISRIRQSFSIEVPLSSLFENPNVAELAEVIMAQQLEQAESEELEKILAEVESN
ncbi:MAG: amino acid adenylation domain-containing protein [Prochloraceae cyanobacterium]|nr:amino acid adenylation domain-containing protein [Prochloraceae cyanobacterium]